MNQEQPFLTLSDVSVSYSEPLQAVQHHVLKQISLIVEKGQLICLLGPSGRGKTTLLNSIAGFQHFEGEIRLNGERIMKPGKDRGVVFQDYALFPWFTVEQNVAFGPKINGMAKKERLELARRYIRMMGLEGFEHFYPIRLSGGMKQRASFARALVNQPACLLMDEPFAALDEQTREALQTELLAIKQQSGITCLFVTHSISEAVYLADRVVVLLPHPGRIALDLHLNLPPIRNRNDERLFHYQKLIGAVLREGESAFGENGAFHTSLEPA